MLGIRREAKGENYDRVVLPAVEDRCKNVGTIATPYITITLKAGFIFR